MIKLFHFPGARSFRILWLLEELGMDYEILPVTLGKRGLEHPDFDAHNPLRTVPTIIDGDMTLTESGAILQYILNKNAPTSLQVKPNEDSYYTYLEWLWLCEATLAQHVVTYRYHTLFLPKDLRIPAVAEQAKKQIQFRLKTISLRLGNNSFAVADRFTGADIMLGHACQAVSDMINAPTLPENLQDYHERMKARPPFARALNC